MKTYIYPKKKLQLAGLLDKAKQNADITGQAMGGAGQALQSIISGGYKKQSELSSGIDMGLDVISAIPGGQIIGGAGKLIKGVYEGITGGQERKKQEKAEAERAYGASRANLSLAARSNVNPNAMGNRLTSINQLGGSTYVKKPELHLPSPNKFTGVVDSTSGKKLPSLNPSSQNAVNRMNTEKNWNALGRNIKYGVQLTDPTTISNIGDTVQAWSNYKKGTGSLNNAIMQSTYHIPGVGKVAKLINKANQVRFTGEHIASENGTPIQYQLGGYRNKRDIPGNMIEATVVNSTDRKRINKDYLYQLGGNTGDLDAISGGKDIDLSSTGQMYVGNKHSEGGIDVMQEGQEIAEVEDGEVKESVDGQDFIFSNIIMNPETKRTFAEDAGRLSLTKGRLEDRLYKQANKYDKKDFTDTRAENGLKLYEEAVKSTEGKLSLLAQGQEKIKQETASVESGSPEAQIGLSQGGQRMEFNNIQPGQEFTGENMDRPTLMQLGTDEGDYMNIKDTKVLNPGETMRIPKGVNKVIEQKMKYGGIVKKSKYQIEGALKRANQAVSDSLLIQEPNNDSWRAENKFKNYSNRTDMNVSPLFRPMVDTQTNLDPRYLGMNVDNAIVNNQTKPNFMSDLKSGKTADRMYNGMKKGALALGYGAYKAAPTIAENADLLVNASLIGKEPKSPLRGTTGYYNPQLATANISPIKQSFRAGRQSLINNSSQNTNAQNLALTAQEAQNVSGEYARVQDANRQARNEASLQNINIQNQNNENLYKNSADRVGQRVDQLSQWKELAGNISNRVQAKNRDKRAMELDKAHLDLMSSVYGSKKQYGGKLKLGK